MNFLYRLGWIFFRVSFWTWLRWRYYNVERVPQTGAVILACNHASILDPPVVGAALNRQINYLARATLFDIPVVGWLFRKWNAIPIDRDGGNAAGLKIILSRLGEGNGIILFPEGTRTRDGNLQPARSGIGLIVVKSTAPVVPVRTFGTFEAMGRNVKFPRPKKVSVKFGQPLNFEKLRVETKTCDKARLKEIYQEIADAIMAEIAKLEPKKD
ncbi:MAG TPA: lysophospholipid acyltransferase family protein [Verrucomicrobiae bacterium]|nr:lysophospholipid acyltransferase family protein [Verrucomicrobiae bacterium]